MAVFQSDLLRYVNVRIDGVSYGSAAHATCCDIDELPLC